MSLESCFAGVALPIGKEVVGGLPGTVMFDSRSIWKVRGFRDQVHCVQLKFDQVSSYYSLIPKGGNVLLETHQHLYPTRTSEHYTMPVEPPHSPS